MDGKIEKFENAELGANIRVIDRDGEPWFVAKEVCDILGLDNGRQATSRLDDDEKDTVILNDGTPGNPDKTIISESGLYNLVIRSDKPNAKEFRRWITHDVLPSIRKHGAYMTPKTVDDILANPESIYVLAKALCEERERKEVLEDREAVFGNRTHYGALSRFNGRPRIDPVRGYLRTTKTTIIEEVAEHQRRLFDWS